MDKLFKIEDSIYIIPSEGRIQITKAFNVGVGDVFTRKKGGGWQRQVTHVMQIDDCVMCAYHEHLNDGRGWAYTSTCSADALRKWGTLENKEDECTSQYS